MYLGSLFNTIAIGITLVTAVISALAFISNRIQKTKNRLADQAFETYNEWINDEGFHQWKTQVIYQIYSSMPAVHVYGKKYPVKCLRAPVNMLTIHENANNLALVYDEKNKHEAREVMMLRKEYSKILSHYIKRPHSTAYALDGIIFNNEDELVGYSAKLCKFEEALLSTFIMEYELAKIYFTDKDTRSQYDASNVEKLLRRMPVRKAIHAKASENEILLSGMNRNAIMSVQMFVLFKSNSNSEYKTFIIKRSDKVSYGPNTWQFIPCGYFEIFGETENTYVVRNNFNSFNTVLREMLEEIFGKEEFIDNKEGLPSENIVNDPISRYIYDQVEREQAYIRFLGVVLDAVTLTHKLSYLLIIDDVEFSQKCFRPNFEASAMETPTINQLHDLVENDRLLPESAGLLTLALAHPLVKERVRGDE